MIKEIKKYDKSIEYSIRKTDVKIESNRKKMLKMVIQISLKKNKQLDNRLIMI